MRSKHAGLILAIGFALAGSLMGSRALAADKVTSDRLLPPNVLAYVAIPDLPESKTSWEHTLLGKLGDDPEFQKFLKDVEVQIDTVSQRFETETGVALNQLCEIPAGEFAAAFLRTRGAGGSIVALLDVGEKHESLDKLLAKADEALKKHGAEKSTEDHSGTEIIIYRLPRPEAEDDGADDEDEAGDKDDKTAAKADDEPAEEEEKEVADKAGADSDADEAEAKKPRTLAYFIKDSRFVVASGTAILDQILERWDGQHKETFAANEEYQYTVKQCRNGESQPMLIWYANPIGIAQAAVQSLGQENLQAQMAMSFLPVLGVSELKCIGGGMSVAADEFDSLSRTFMYIDYPTSGLLNAFHFTPTEQTPPKWVPQNASTYFSVNWDVSKAYAAVEKLYDSFQGPDAFGLLLDQLAEQDGGSKVHVKKDILNQLTGKIHFVSDVAKSDAESDEDAAAAERFLVALELKDPAKAEALIARLSQDEKFTGKKRELAGTTFYEFETTPLGAIAGVTSTMGLGVIQGHVMIASNVTTIEGILQPDPQHASLADSIQYRKLAAHFPAKTSIIGFHQQDAQARALYESLRSGSVGDLIEGIDFSNLPPYEVIEKYLPASASYVVPDEHGVLWVSFSLQKVVEAAAK